MYEVDEGEPPLLLKMGATLQPNSAQIRLEARHEQAALYEQAHSDQRPSDTDRELRTLCGQAPSASVSVSQTRSRDNGVGP